MQHVPQKRILVIIVLLGLLILGGVALWNRVYPLAMPWEPTGELAVLMYAVPNDADQSESIVLGIADIALVRNDGPLSLNRTTIRVPLTPPPLFERIITETVPVGRYNGITFTIQSPEVRNAWQGDAAPEGLSLVHSNVELPVPFTVHPDTMTILLAGFETDTAIYAHDGGRVFLPIITIEVREHGDITFSTNGIQVTGGTIDHSALFGMQWNGVMRRNVRAPKQPDNEPAFTLDVQDDETATVGSSTAPATIPASTTVTHESPDVHDLSVDPNSTSSEHATSTEFQQ